MAINATKSARDFISALAQAGNQPNAQFSAAELAGVAALEWRGSGETIRAECARRIVALLSDLGASATSKPILRARAGDTLARLGDPRFDAGHGYLPAEPLFGFIEIPAGDFKMGDDPHRVSLPQYYLARWPVTVAQFAAFVRDSGHEPASPNCLKGLANHPVVYVTWHEAMAYCRWLNEPLRKFAHKRLATEKTLSESERRFWQKLVGGALGVGLPSEAEWEKAACGEDRRIYPWGDRPDPQKANYVDTGLNATSAVGCFPGGASPYGCEEMCGNVLEWTRSLYGNYPYPPEGPQRQAQEDLNAPDNVSRVLRGGAFRGDARLARCAFRSGSDPGARLDDYGFRVVVSPFFSDR
jgi:formylglycine-generating enzyme required for sulfatase activity